MACEAEQQALAQAQGVLDALLSQYDDLVWQIAGVSGQVQGAQAALDLCQGNLTASSDDLSDEDLIALFRESSHDLSAAVRSRFINSDSGGPVE